MFSSGKRLYRLVHSDENLTEAWHKVKTKGSGTAGIDGVSVTQFQRYLFQKLKALQRDLRKRRYQPQPAKIAYIRKDNGKKRPIGILTVRDRIVQRAVLNVVEPIFEAKFDNCSYGFRPGRSVQMALEHLSRLINNGYLWAVKLDVQQCFESIDIRKLERVVTRTIKDHQIRKLIREWLVLKPVQLSGRGIARRIQLVGLLQGSPLSPLLANVYLDQFDKRAKRRGLYTIRYADDIIILCQTHNEAKKALRKASKILTSINLSVNPHKTQIIHVEEGLSFLGATLEFQTSEDGESRWVPSFPEPKEEHESSGPVNEEVGPEDLKYLLEEVRKHRDGHPVYR